MPAAARHGVPSAKINAYKADTQVFCIRTEAMLLKPNCGTWEANPACTWWPQEALLRSVVACFLWIVRRY